MTKMRMILSKIFYRFSESHKNILCDFLCVNELFRIKNRLQWNFVVTILLKTAK